MFVTEPLAGHLKICLRCQYRLAVRENILWPSFPISRGRQPRRISQTSRLSQQPAAAAYNDSLDPDVVGYDAELPSVIKTPHAKFKKIQLYKRDPLDISTLGRPTEALILRSQTALPHPEKEAPVVLKTLETGEKLFTRQTPPSASDLLEQIEAESGVVDVRQVAQHLEEIRSTFANEIPRNRKPTAVEFHALERKIDEGFSKRQLAEYCGQDEEGLSFDLSSSYSHALFTRSSWDPVIKEFPGNAAQRLKNIQEGVEIKSSGPKSAILDRILRNRWHINTIDDDERPGQIDIWPRRVHLKLLLNHSEQYPSPLFEITMD